MLIDLSRGRKTKISSFVVPIILIPVICVGMHYLQKFLDRKLPPAPETVTFKAYPYKIVNVKTHTETRHNDDGPDDTITTYYLVYEHEGQEKTREVDSRIHSAFKNAGMYYLYQAEGEDKRIDFMIYPMSEYIAAHELSLPIGPHLTDDEIVRVAESVVHAYRETI